MDLGIKIIAGFGVTALIVAMVVAIVSLGTDGNMSKIKSYGDSRTIECYSGGKLIYKGESTGKIQSERSSDGYYFREKSSNKLMEVSGNCVIGK